MPQAGTRPAILTGRDTQLENFGVLLERMENGLVDQFPLIMGLRGVGKTVLLNAFEDLAVERGWRTHLAEPGPDVAFREIVAQWMKRTLPSLARGKPLLDRLRERFSALNAFSVSISSTGEVGVAVTAPPPAGVFDQALASDLTEIFLEIGYAASQRHTGAALFIDEVQMLKQNELAALIMALHRVAQKGLPVGFAAAGLPQLPKLVGNARSYAERLFDFVLIDRLNPEAARKAIEEPALTRNVQWSSNAIEEIVRLSDGYPFFLQQYAKFAWLYASDNKITESDVKESADDATQRLDIGFFETRLQRTTGRERQYLSVMSDLKSPYLTGEIAKRLGGTINRWSPVRNSLIEKGIIYSSSRGEIDFTVPHFAEFLKRRQKTTDIFESPMKKNRS